MADNRNMELNDEMMAKAAGGADSGIPAPKFKAGDIAICLKSGYRVRILKVLEYYNETWGWHYVMKYLHNGAETDFAYDKNLAYCR